MILTMQHKLLIVAGALALIRFGIHPWLEHQQEQKQQLQLVTQQLERTERLIHNRDSIQSAAVGLQQSRQQMAEQFPSIGASGQYRLDRQQSIQQQLSEHKVDVTLFDWLSQQSMQNDQIELHQARLVLQGEPLQLMHGYQAAFAQHSWVRVRQFELRQRPGGRRQARAQATLTVLVEFTSLRPQAMQGVQE